MPRWVNHQNIVICCGQPRARAPHKICHVVVLFFLYKIISARRFGEIKTLGKNFHNRDPSVFKYRLRIHLSNLLISAFAISFSSF